MQSWMPSLFLPPSLYVCIHYRSINVTLAMLSSAATDVGNTRSSLARGGGTGHGQYTLLGISQHLFATIFHRDKKMGPMLL